MKWKYAATIVLAALAVAAAPSLWAAADEAGTQGGFQCSCEAKSGKGDSTRAPRKVRMRRRMI